MLIDLPLPHRALWPNGRAHWRTKATQTKKHRHWAHTAAMAQRKTTAAIEQPVINITLYPNARGPAPDRDNIISSAKAYCDGIADALGLNDRHFTIGSVTISERRTSRMAIQIGAA
jgi:crossover junction endodeoxyribonuclease RusA